MYPPKPPLTKVVMSALTVVLTSVAVFGNGSILAVIIRFKSFRTVPNTLIANIAVVDMLNAAINMPIHMISVVLEARWFRGQTLAIVSSFFNRLFIILNLASMLVLMANMYFPIACDLRYLAWMTNTKAVVCSFLVWLLGTMVAVLYSIPLLRIDLGDAHVIEYRAEIYKQGKHYIAAFMLLFLICSGVLGFLTVRSIKRKKKLQRPDLNLPALEFQTRLQNDIKASKTIAITIAAYFFSYVPAVVYAIVGHQEESQADSWFGFLAWYAIFVSTIVNPIIYYVRSSRYRSAFKQFFKNPFGTSKFDEKARNRGKGRGFDATKKSDNERQIMAGIERRKKYHSKRRNGMMISSIQTLQAHLFVREVTETDNKHGRVNPLPKKIDARFTSAALVHPVSVELSPLARLPIKAREASAPKHQGRQKPCKRKEEKTDEGNEVSKKRTSEHGTRKRNRPFSRTKVHPLSKSCENLSFCLEQKNTKIQMIPGNRRNSIQ